MGCYQSKYIAYKETELLDGEEPYGYFIICANGSSELPITTQMTFKLHFSTNSRFKNPILIYPQRQGNEVFFSEIPFSKKNLQLFQKKISVSVDLYDEKAHLSFKYSSKTFKYALFKEEEKQFSNEKIKHHQNILNILIWRRLLSHQKTFLIFCYLWLQNTIIINGLIFSKTLCSKLNI